MAAVDVVQLAVGGEAEDGHGGVLLDILAADVAIDDVGDRGQRLARDEQRIDEPLERGAEDGGGDSFAGDVGDDDGEGFAVVDDVEEVASAFAAGHGTRGHGGPGEGGGLTLIRPR